MITLTAFVVISQHALPTNNIAETIFKRMLRRRDSFRDSPNGHPAVDGKAARVPKRTEKWLGLFEQLFPKDKWSHSWVDVLGKAR